MNERPDPSDAAAGAAATQARAHENLTNRRNPTTTRER